LSCFFVNFVTIKLHAMKKILFILCVIFVALSVAGQPKKTQVDFSYSFAEPHRLTVCLPNSSHKTYLDASSSQFQMSWSDHDCTEIPLGAFVTYPTPWRVTFSAKVDSLPLKGLAWHREANWIPAFCYEWEGDDVHLQARVVATEKGDVVQFEALNKGSKTRKVTIDCNVRGVHINMKWQDADYKYNVVTPIGGDRGDRILILDPVPTAEKPLAMGHIDMVLSVAPGATISRLLVRPNAAYLDDIDKVAAMDWKVEADKGLLAWRTLIAKAPALNLPDEKSEEAFKACLADMFVMREKQSDGKMAGLCGTEVYRAPNSFEPCFQAMALCRLGYYEEAKENLAFASQFQEADGNWNDMRQWNRFMWGASGIKSYYTKEYYLQSRDTAFLQEQFPRMLASSRWSQRQRDLTKKNNNHDSPLWGLLPRGMGDCGLKDGGDFFGVFYPHNFLHCLGLEVNAWAAKELGRKDVYKELYADYQDLYDCLQKSLKTGCIHEKDGTAWIPGTPNKTSGSRWGVAEAVYPAKIISPSSPLAIGTMKRLQRDISEGGLPQNLGWMQGGLWVAIALDAMAYVDILQGNADLASQYYYATLNHGTPLYSWCEERMPEKGATKTSGDRQHAWTPICVVRFTRDMLVMEDEDEGCLWLTRAVPRWWYGVGEKIEVSDMPTQFGKVTYRIERADVSHLRFSITLKDYALAHPLKIQLRLPDKATPISASKVQGARVKMQGECLTIMPKDNVITGEINLK
jgi:hypothetical protein